jgi:hypothetical protein
MTNPQRVLFDGWLDAQDDFPVTPGRAYRCVWDNALEYNGFAAPQEKLFRTWFDALDHETPTGPNSFFEVWQAALTANGLPAEALRHPDTELFSLSEVPAESRPRWFIKRGAYIHTEAGFGSKESANAWLADLGRRLDWRAGSTFRLRGDYVSMELVDRAGRRAPN